MIKRIILALVLLQSAWVINAQTPKSTKVIGEVGQPILEQRSVMCNEAGTVNLNLTTASESNNIEFLCFGDVLNIDHNEDFDLSGDPNALTDPGIGYAFFSCTPTIDGMTLADIQTDPCLITTSPIMIGGVTLSIGMAGVWIATNPLVNSADIQFINDGNIQEGFGANGPTEIFFAPLTLDIFSPQGFENSGGAAGPCVDLNVDESFRVVYLNEITISNINTNIGGNGCAASLLAEGGLSEFDGSNYTTVSIQLAADPTVEGTFAGALRHGETLEFSVPQPGIYNIIIEDGTSCPASTQIDMSGCAPVSFDIPDDFAMQTENICIPVTINDFNGVSSFQFTMEWDDTVLDFTDINNLNLPPNFGFGPPAGSVNDFVVISWNDPLLNQQTLPSPTDAFEICFNVIGAAGTSSPIDITSNQQNIEVTDGTFGIGYTIGNGSVTVSSGNTTIDATTCSSTLAQSMGAFTITLTGGTAPYTYTWEEDANPGNNGAGIVTTQGGSSTENNLPPGDYNIVVMDATGATDVATVTIANVDPLVVQRNFTNPTCVGDTDGSITLNIVGGVTPYSIEWSTGPADNDQTTISGLGQGSYAATVTDMNGCEVISSGGLLTFTIMYDTINLQHVTCTGGGNDGAITVQGTGGVIAPGSDYDYVWDDAGTTTGPTLTNLTPATYCVDITDDNNCTQNFCITINAPVEPIITGFDSVSVACPNDMNGELTVLFTEGNSMVNTFEWTPTGVGNTANITNLNADDYAVTITDADGCSDAASVTLWAPQLLSLDSVITTPPTCPSDANGSIALFISGGSGAGTYDIAWSTGGTFPVLPAIPCDSTYTVVITDQTMCLTLFDTIYLPCPPTIGVQFTDLEEVSCNGGFPCDGQATAVAFGGTEGSGNYNYTWSSGENILGVPQSTATQLCQGFNVVEVNDGICSIMDSVEIAAPPPLSIDIANTFSTPASCFGADDGGATVQAMGGTPMYTYNWSTSDMGQSISGVEADTFFVVITDANMCNFSFAIEVGEPDSLVASIDSTNTMEVSCFELADGQVAVTWEGGNPGPATFNWTDNVSTTSTAIGLDIGTYMVTVTDMNGCSDVTEYSVDQPTPVQGNIPAVTQPLCNGFQTFITVDTAFGGDGTFYSFSVDNGPQQQINNNIAILAGPHLVSIFDGSNCSIDTTIIVNEPPPVNVDLGPDVEIELGDETELEAIIGAIVPIDSIFWTPLDSLACLNMSCDEVLVSPLNTTTYSVTVMDVNSCVGTDEIIVEVDKNRNVFIPNGFSPNGDGVNDIFQAFVGLGVENITFMHVFDRWGELLWEETNFLPEGFSTQGWDGMFKGKKMNPGVYVYLAEVEFSDGLTLLYRGTVTLVR